MTLARPRLARLHDILAGHVERGEIPGLVGIIARRGELHVEAIGVPRDAIFRIASMTKPITAAAALILVEECKLRLDEPVDRLLPELANRTVLTRMDGPLDEVVHAHRPITVRDLLTFRMGLGNFGAPAIVQAMTDLELGQHIPSPSLPPPPDEWLRRLGTLPLMCQPGERWLYSTGSDVLAVLIARASGQPFETFLRERLFEPLGMKDTGFSVPTEQIGRLPASYWNNPTTGALEIYDASATGQWIRPPAFPSGAGGLVATADDYLAFARMLLDGGARILSRPSVELMTTDQLTPAQKAISGLVPGQFEALGFGFGVAVVTRRDGPLSVGSYGWDGGLGTTWRNDPREQMVTILLTQRAWTAPMPPAVALDFWTAAYAAIDD